MENFNEALENWLEKVEVIVNEQYGHISYMKKTISMMVGRKYIRIVTEDSPGSRSAFCFIDKETGDVLKTASWKKPAKHARGNIFTDELGVGACGAHYMW